LAGSGFKTLGLGSGRSDPANQKVAEKSLAKGKSIQKICNGHGHKTTDRAIRVIDGFLAENL
jgi:hypothetical protein